MEIRYGVTGKDRKALVTAIAEITGVTAVDCQVKLTHFFV